MLLLRAVPCHCSALLLSAATSAATSGARTYSASNDARIVGVLLLALQPLLVLLLLKLLRTVLILLMLLPLVLQVRVQLALQSLPAVPLL